MSGDPVHLAEQHLHPVAPQVAEVQDAQQVGSLQLPGRLEDLLWKTRRRDGTKCKGWSHRDTGVMRSILEFFCKNEQEEYEVKMAQLGKMEAEVPQMIQERKLKIKEIKDTVELSNEEADEEKADARQTLTALIGWVEKCLDDFNQMVKERLKSTEKQAEDLIKELEQEVVDLTKRMSTVKQLLHTEDHLHFLQAFRSLKDPPRNRIWSAAAVRPPSYKGALGRSLDQLEETLNIFFIEMKKLRSGDELKRVQKHKVDVATESRIFHPRFVMRNISEGLSSACLIISPVNQID
ncbi:unnamed protein product [Arctogadus glacialis]